MQRLLGSIILCLLTAAVLTATASAATFSGPAISGSTSPTDVNSESGPSVATVSGQSGVVADVNVMLRFNTPSDVSYFDFLLVAPNGAASLLLSDCLYYSQYGYTLFNVFLDQSADTDPPYGSLPVTANGQTFTYRPKNCHNSPGSNGDGFSVLLPSADVTPNLNRFNGIDPNGQWKLYVGGSGSSFSQQTTNLTGWTLELATQPIPSDTVAPVVTRPAVSGKTLGFSLSEAASLKILVDRGSTGLKKKSKSGSRCVKRPKGSRGSKCTRWTALPGELTGVAGAGNGTFPWNGRLGGKKLAPGTYRLTLTATDAAGNASAPVAYKVTVKKPKAKKKR